LVEQVVDLVRGLDVRWERDLHVHLQIALDTRTHERNRRAHHVEGELARLVQDTRAEERG
jgi:hypothetical protein